MRKKKAENGPLLKRSSIVALSLPQKHLHEWESSKLLLSRSNDSGNYVAASPTKALSLRQQKPKKSGKTALRKI